MTVLLTSFLSLSSWWKWRSRPSMYSDETLAAYQAAADLLANTGGEGTDLARRVDALLKSHHEPRASTPTILASSVDVATTNAALLPVVWDFGSVPPESLGKSLDARPPSPMPLPLSTPASTICSAPVERHECYCVFCSHGGNEALFFIITLPHQPTRPAFHVCATCLFGEMALLDPGVELSRRVLQVYDPHKK